MQSERHCIVQQLKRAERPPLPFSWRRFSEETQRLLRAPGGSLETVTMRPVRPLATSVPAAWPSALQ